MGFFCYTGIMDILLKNKKNLKDIRQPTKEQIQLLKDLRLAYDSVSVQSQSDKITLEVSKLIYDGFGRDSVEYTLFHSNPVIRHYSDTWADRALVKMKKLDNIIKFEESKTSRT